MIIKVRGLTWAVYSSGGDGDAITYTGGKYDKDKIVRVDQSEERSDVTFNADDHTIDRDNSITGANLSIELAKLPEDMLTAVLGYVADGSGSSATGYNVTDAAAPYVGVGFIHGEMYKGEETYTAYWYHKVQFSRGNRSMATKGDTTAFQTETIEGEAMGVQLASNGPSIYFTQSKEFSTEAQARTWLNSKAGVSST